MSTVIGVALLLCWEMLQKINVAAHWVLCPSHACIHMCGKEIYCLKVEFSANPVSLDRSVSLNVHSKHLGGMFTVINIRYCDSENTLPRFRHVGCCGKRCGILSSAVKHNSRRFALQNPCRRKIQHHPD